MKMLSHTCKAELYSSKRTQGCSGSLQNDITLVLLRRQTAAHLQHNAISTYLVDGGEAELHLALKRPFFGATRQSNVLILYRIHQD